MRQTDNVEHLRDSMQHLAENIYDFSQRRIPPWGTLSWVVKADDSKSCRIFSIVPGEIFERWTPLVNPLGKRFGVPIGLVTLTSSTEVCLSDVVEMQIPAIAGWLNRKLVIDFDKPASSVMAAAHMVFGQTAAPTPLHFSPEE